MTGIEADVFEAFLARIADSEHVSDLVVAGLREKLAGGAEKLPKPDDLARLFAEGSGDASA